MSVCDLIRRVCGGDGRRTPELEPLLDNLESGPQPQRVEIERVQQPENFEPEPQPQHVERLRQLEVIEQTERVERERVERERVERERMERERVQNEEHGWLRAVRGWLLVEGGYGDYDALVKLGLALFGFLVFMAKSPCQSKLASWFVSMPVLGFTMVLFSQCFVGNGRESIRAAGMFCSFVGIFGLIAVLVSFYLCPSYYGKENCFLTTQ